MVVKNKIEYSRIKFFWILLTGLVLVSKSLSAQDFGSMAVEQNLSSGIIVPLNSSNEIGVVQFKIDDMDEAMYATVLKEFKKYEGEIVNCGADIVEKKLIVSYISTTYPNFLLAILDRVNIHAYYELNGTQTFYVKDGHSAFIR